MSFNYNNSNLLSPSDNASTAMLVDSCTVDSFPVTFMPSTSVDNLSTSIAPATTDYQYNNCDNNNSPLRLFSHN
jgi:hypothetical protein